ncbi:sugar transferase [Myroides odoratimimus]|uniref:sugar transferase n=1 Tax=Myroides odoratimimus TaxID=76832 RepID=UPI0025769225|nr:sugar transferase [Myroides odoratimimus]MDM1521201.1 sugar transferase [Myroides odoratimimus]
MYKNFVKRLLDFSMALLGLIFLSPVFFSVMLCLLIANQGKPFFFQARPGKNSKIFKVIKFKTMNDRTDNKGELLADKERLTSIGIFVRKTSLDEIPQLINVLKGDMSLIGPRPLLPKYLPFYTKVEERRHDVRPGITGWAQVNGRNLLEWDKRLEFDVYYVENISFSLDIKIFYLTIKNVLRAKSIIVDPSSVMLDLDDERRSKY